MIATLQGTFIERVFKSIFKERKIFEVYLCFHLFKLTSHRFQTHPDASSSRCLKNICNLKRIWIFCFTSWKCSWRPPTSGASFKPEVTVSYYTDRPLPGKHTYFFAAVNWFTRGFVYETLLLDWLTYHLQTRIERTSERALSNWDTTEIKKDVLKNRYISNYFMLVVSSTPC